MWLLAGRAVMWGLTGLGLVKATETVTAATGGGVQSDTKPSIMAWLMVSGILALAIWLTFKHFKGAKS